jgi:hypothetical protein
MTEQERQDKVNSIALKNLQGYLISYDKESWSEDKKVEFLGEAYAQMLMLSFLGYYPDRMAADAISGTERLNSMIREKGGECD